MICEQCLRTDPVDFSFVAILRRLGASLARSLRSALASLAQLG